LTENQHKPYDPIETLARSLFGFGLLAWMPMLITWVLFVVSPVSPDATFAQIRTVIIVGFGILTVIGFGIVVWLFRKQPEDQMPLSRLLNRVLGNRWVAGVILLLLLEINFLAFLTLGNVAPAITNPAKFLLVCWSLILFGLVMTVNWNGLQSWLNRTQGIWVSTGLMMVAIVILGLLFLITSQIVTMSGIVGRLQGQLDYRQLEFIDDGNMPTPQQFWAEQGQMSVRWLPYNYWTVAPFEGQFINIDSQGIRFTPSYTDDETAPKVYFFGGSTMWGEGARDAYTIAGHSAKLFADENQEVRVTNYGQTGYVSAQDMILFQAQLAQNNLPEIAVFYQGFNDVYSAYLQDITGIPYRENQRVSDVEAGRLLRSGQPMLRLPDGDISGYDWSLVGSASVEAEVIADRWFAHVGMIAMLAESYGIEVMFVWQPALFAKDNRVADEQRILDELDVENPDFVQLYQDVDSIVRQRVEDDNLDDVLILTELFRNNEQAIFYDLVHITEIGNLAVAEAILPTLLNLLEK